MRKFTITWFDNVDVIEAEGGPGVTDSEAALEIARQRWLGIIASWPDGKVRAQLSKFRCDESNTLENKRRRQFLARKEKQHGQTIQKIEADHGPRKCYEVLADGDYQQGYTVRAA